MKIRHRKECLLPNGEDQREIQPSDWNEYHDVAPDDLPVVVANAATGEAANCSAVVEAVAIGRLLFVSGRLDMAEEVAGVNIRLEGVSAAMKRCRIRAEVEGFADIQLEAGNDEAGQLVLRAMVPLAAGAKISFAGFVPVACVL
ncbi:MAG: hypothetical protein H6R10_588 [Rhodocyclaceae bacterium]|nr:hypothetical protein [Rhodocyclaceae bacterium]